MKITNKYNLPETVYKACASNNHKKADFSITELLKDPTEIALTKVYEDQLEMDCSESINLLLGRAVHKVFEDTSVKDHYNEVFMTYTLENGQVVSGSADVIDLANRKILDYKICSVWKVLKGDYRDWSEQIKGYAFLYYKSTGKFLTNGQIIALMKDHTQSSVGKTTGYPEVPVVTIDFEYSEEEILEVEKEWLSKTNEVLEMIRTKNFGQCSPEGRWAKASQYALMKEGRKTAVKVYESLQEAREAVTSDAYYIEKRGGEDAKCNNYCIVGKCGFCPYKNQKDKEE